MGRWNLRYEFPGACIQRGDLGLYPPRTWECRAGGAGFYGAHDLSAQEIRITFRATNARRTMKRTILTLTFGLACASAFAQGRIQFSNDSLHLVYYDPAFGSPLGGQPVYGSNMWPGLTFVADFYMGTSS